MASEDRVKNSTPIQRTIRNILILIFVGFVYYLVVRFTNFGFKCFVHELTGFNCPACGMTRMIVSASKLHFREAFHYNRFMFASMPFVVGEIIYLLYLNESKKPANKINLVVTYTWLAFFVLYGILRNVFPI